MATTGRLFYNSVRGMNREELIQYVSKYAETLELKVLLNTFDQIRKGCVLNDEMNAALLEIEMQLKKPETAPSSITVGEAYLIMLEGRILMLLLKQSLARDLGDEKLAFATGQQVTALFAEYVLAGGKRSFTSPRYNFKYKNMKVQRGIVETKTTLKTEVKIPGHLYILNNNKFYNRKIKVGEKVLGVVTENKFNICREFISEEGFFVFGYLLSEPSSDNKITIQTISEFDIDKFDPYSSEFNSGSIISAAVA